MQALDEKLRRAITLEKPFGPTNAVTLTDVAVFDGMLEGNNRIFGSCHGNPSIVLGRRGSGKTSFMRSTRNYDVVEEVSTARTFAEVVQTISQHGEVQFYEEVADLWEQFIYLAVFRGVSSRFKSPAEDAAVLKDYNAKHGIKDGGKLDNLLWKVVHAARAAKNDAIALAGALVNEVAGVDFPKAKEAAINMLRHNDARALLLIDSVEQYPFGAKNLDYAIGGLLHCVGEFNEQHDYVNVRLALPAEVYHRIAEYAPNPEKNFANNVTLHWHASELLRIAAHRLAIFLRLYYPEFHASLGAEGRANPQRLLETVLPREITNGLGVTEGPVPYILRHTQLMPRHLLRYLNSIFGPSFRHGRGPGDVPAVKESDVRTGIRNAEIYLSDEVCSAYRGVYPTLKHALEDCIPHLPLRFADGDLRTTYNRHGKKRTDTADYSDFKRMLIAAGVIGNFDRETEKYYTAHYEYTAVNKIRDHGGPYCLHPIFAAEFGCIRNSVDSKKPVYPFGSDPAAGDYREVDG